MVLVLATALSASLPRAVHAQVMLTPVAGAYVPTGNLYEASGSIGTAKQNTSFLFGARLLVSASGQFGIEAGAFYTPASVRITTTTINGDITEVTRSANVTLGHLRLLYVINSEWAAANAYIGAGVAVIDRGGESFEGVQGLTDWGANLVIGALFRLGPAFRVRLEVEDYMYETEFTFSTGETSRPRFQNDFVFTIGLSIPIG